MPTTPIKVRYIPDERRATWLFPGGGSSFRSISVWEWEPVFQATLGDFKVPGSDLYIDGNGDAITEEEAQVEVNFLNGLSDE